MKKKLIGQTLKTIKSNLLKQRVQKKDGLQQDNTVEFVERELRITTLTDSVVGMNIFVTETDIRV